MSSFAILQFLSDSSPQPPKLMPFWVRRIVAQTKNLSTGQPRTEKLQKDEADRDDYDVWFRK